MLTALNRDFRYQLTALHAPGPGLHIASRIGGGRFTIAGGQAGQQVCWQVTGVRQDAWSSAHRIPVEVAKPDTDRGRYLHPDLYPGGGAGDRAGPGHRALAPPAPGRAPEPRPGQTGSRLAARPGSLTGPPDLAPRPVRAPLAVRA